jgi:hypothetical protein
MKEKLLSIIHDESLNFDVRYFAMKLLIKLKNKSK